jgi:phosphate transport system permease protein
MLSTLGVAIPISLGLALAATVYLPPGTARSALQGLLQLLNAMPSILFGIVGYLFFFHFLDWGKSWLAGGLVLGWMILPTVTVSLIKSMEAIPQRQIHAAAGLGLRRGQIIRSVYLPQSVRGLFTGGLLGLARAAGETAPILFVATVFAGVSLPDGIKDNPVLALPYHIFVLAQDSLQVDAIENLWATAFVLVALVVGLSLAVLPFRLHSSTRQDHA